MVEVPFINLLGHELDHINAFLPKLFVILLKSSTICRIYRDSGSPRSCLILTLSWWSDQILKILNANTFIFCFRILSPIFLDGRLKSEYKVQKGYAKFVCLKENLLCQINLWGVQRRRKNGHSEQLSFYKVSFLWMHTLCRSLSQDDVVFVLDFVRL